MPGPALCQRQAYLDPRGINSPRVRSPIVCLGVFCILTKQKDLGNLPSPWVLAVKTLPNTVPCTWGAGTSDLNSVEGWALWPLHHALSLMTLSLVNPPGKAQRSPPRGSSYPEEQTYMRMLPVTFLCWCRPAVGSEPRGRRGTLSEIEWGLWCWSGPLHWYSPEVPCRLRPLSPELWEPREDDPCRLRAASSVVGLGLPSRGQDAQGGQGVPACGRLSVVSRQGVPTSLFSSVSGRGGDRVRI